MRFDDLSKREQRIFLNSFAFSTLTEPMQRALIDLVSFGALYCEDARWQFGSRVLRFHRQSTVKALARRRLCQIVPMSTSEAAYPTRAGRQLVEAYQADLSARSASR